jgi:hypothetical protein
MFCANNWIIMINDSFLNMGRPNHCQVKEVSCNLSGSEIEAHIGISFDFDKVWASMSLEDIGRPLKIIKN